MVAVASAASAMEAPSGASLFYTSGVPAIVSARQMVAEGRLAEGERALTEAGRRDSTLSPVSQEGAEIIRRIRSDYSSNATDLLKRIRKDIPDVSEADLEKWRKAGQLQYRVIDGNVLYFRREPSNLFRFCPEAIERRDGAKKRGVAKDSFETPLVRYLKKVVAAAKASGQAEVLPVKHHVTYRVTVSPNRPGARAGSLVRAWLPYPQEYRQQGSIRLIRTDPAEHQINPIGIRDGRILPEAQRAIYFEKRIDDPAKPIVFEEELEYVCANYYPQLSDDTAKPFDPKKHPELADYVAERPPHIRFTPEIQAAVREAIGNETNPLKKVRKIYHWIDEHVRYCAEEEYTIIPSFSQKAITSRKGDCGILGTLFTTMCRSAGVPARWQSGWESKPWGYTMHDWAEFYMEPWGWLPADMSYGLQASDDPEVREYYIGHLDAYRMIVNLDYGCPLVPEKRSLRSEPADFQRGEIEMDGRNLYFDEWDYEMKFAWEPVSEHAAR
jgi:transglutaminase-like putative cysteine protease